MEACHPLLQAAPQAAYIRAPSSNAFWMPFGLKRVGLRSISGSMTGQWSYVPQRSHKFFDSVLEPRCPMAEELMLFGK